MSGDFENLWEYATKRSIFYHYSHLFQKLAPKALTHVYSTSEKSHLFVGPLNFIIQSLLGMLASRLYAKDAKIGFPILIPQKFRFPL